MADVLELADKCRLAEAIAALYAGPVSVLQQHPAPVDDWDRLLQAVETVEGGFLAEPGGERSEPCELLQERGAPRCLQQAPVLGDTDAKRTIPGQQIEAVIDRAQGTQPLERVLLAADQRQLHGVGEDAYACAHRLGAQRVGDGEMCGHARDQPARVREDAGRFAQREGADQKGRFFVRAGAAQVGPELRRYADVLPLDDLCRWIEQRGNQFVVRRYAFAPGG